MRFFEKMGVKWEGFVQDGKNIFASEAIFSLFYTENISVRENFETKVRYICKCTALFVRKIKKSFDIF